MTEKTTRRDFLGNAGTAAGFGFGILGARSARADDPPKNAGKVPVAALIGCGGMGIVDIGNIHEPQDPHRCGLRR